MRDLLDQLGRNEHLPLGHRRKKTGHRWVLLAETDDQVIDSAKPPTATVDQIAADDEREMKDTRWCHAGRTHRRNDRDRMSGLAV
jgi:hypothetical protein